MMVVESCRCPAKGCELLPAASPGYSRGRHSNPSIPSSSPFEPVDNFRHSRAPLVHGPAGARSGGARAQARLRDRGAGPGFPDHRARPDAVRSRRAFSQPCGPAIVASRILTNRKGKPPEISSAPYHNGSL